MPFIILTHTWRLALLGEIEPYFDLLFMFRDLLCTVAPSLRTYNFRPSSSENLGLLVIEQYTSFRISYVLAY
jgi:hypothetical protein